MFTGNCFVYISVVFVYIIVVLWQINCIALFACESIWKLKYWIVYFCPVLCAVYNVSWYVLSVGVSPSLFCLSLLLLLSLIFSFWCVSTNWWILINSNLTDCNTDNTCMHIYANTIACMFWHARTHTHRHAHVYHTNTHKTKKNPKDWHNPAYAYMHTKTHPYPHPHPTPSVITAGVWHLGPPHPHHIHTVNDVQKIQTHKRFKRMLIY